MNASAHATDVQSTIATSVASVQARIASACSRAGRAPEAITLIAVSKMQPAATVVAAYHAGVRDFGENYVQEGLPKMAEVRRLLGNEASPRWHLIGALQTNKARKATGAFSYLHALTAARALDAVAAAAGARLQPVFVEVNVARDPAKHGVLPEDLGALLELAGEHAALKVEGLMTVAPHAASPEAARPHFRTLRVLAGRYGLTSLSMGMTGDFEVAVEEGATHVRVGRAIFGERLHP